MLLLILALANFARDCIAVPFDSAGNSSSVEIVWVTELVTAEQSFLPSGTGLAILETSGSVTSLLLAPAESQNPPSLPAASSLALLATPTVTSPMSVLLFPPNTVTDILTSTVTATLTEPPTTVTVTAPPLTATDVVTISPLPPPSVPQTAWTAPSRMSDLADFNVTNFACGQKNLHVVDGIPVDISAVTLNTMAGGANTSDFPLPWDNSSTALQLFYPESSINPGTEPQGGADFYATPLDLHNAKNVSLEYSVFFPADFEFVLGGKLPGLYGGRMGCSGGDVAVTCFSTRLMWRAGGAGELYLYAPKNKQTRALCSTPPLSVCDAEYGLSIGRGSFYFAAGGWTRVRQTVTLNTPGAQNGGFVLEVNGKRVINRSDVYYRDAPVPQQSPDDGDGSDGADGQSAPDPEPTSQPDPDGDDGGLLGGLFGPGGILGHVALWPGSSGILVMRDDSLYAGSALLPSPTALTEQPIAGAAASPSLAQCMAASYMNGSATQAMSNAFNTAATCAQPGALTQTVTPVTTSTTTVYPTVAPTTELFAIEAMQASEPIRFAGLFFSTFFGGHEPEYASPKDQYAWFKDFSMTINS
ncbi:polysaccharide lyase family 14 protein [Laetiporus sulphureus 93-53]|uniref:Polysaccharide lyase family 14 protein n=1 Tax=Laetiporus sulphureus 93-53 TaxID=1314785 RepID=A0A165H234_9APHY|nr:polysaccharide lyase family 14 protein [Laetiporus sulphureus 93-53]KZT11137.1 polysaccharide lyase family 14 protein [Laetiporus sulphureus 93-53]